MTMKALAVFLSFYLILLCCIPCVDAPGKDTCRKMEMSRHSAGHPQNDADHCSPFCTCQCCQANFCPSAPPEITSTPAVGFNYSENSLDFQSIVLSDFLVPPKA